MRVVLQRVRSGSVLVEDEAVGSIMQGLVILAAIGTGDTSDDVERMARKIVNLRIFNDTDGRFNRSVLDVSGGILVISQFTLYADTKRGRRPNFTAAAAPDQAESLLAHFAGMLSQLGVSRVETGQFGTSMVVDLQNDGPVTICLDTSDFPTATA